MDAQSRPAATLSDVALTAVFLAAIFLPPLAALFGAAPTAGLTEKRAPASPPALTGHLRALKTFPRRFDAYWNDAFGFRSTLVRSYNRLALTISVTPSNKVVIGTAGWLFVGQDYGAVEYYRATRPFSREQLVWWQHVLETRRDWLARRGARYLFLVAPDKHTIYPEYMPATLNRVGTATRLDQLIAHLEANSDFRILDLRAVLRQAKAHDAIYEPLDSHWNDLGAWFAYDEIVKQVGVWFPRVQPLPLASYDRRWVSGQGNDLAALLSLSDLLPGERLTLVPRTPRRARWLETHGPLPLGSVALSVSEMDDPSLPRAVVLHDSFGDILQPFLAEHFARGVYSRQNRFAAELIERERPNIVLHEMVERSLMTDFSADPTEVTRAWPDGGAEPRS